MWPAAGRAAAAAAAPVLGPRHVRVFCRHGCDQASVSGLESNRRSRGERTACSLQKVMVAAPLGVDTDHAAAESLLFMTRMAGCAWSAWGVRCGSTSGRLPFVLAGRIAAVVAQGPSCRQAARQDRGLQHCSAGVCNVCARAGWLRAPTAAAAVPPSTGDWGGWPDAVAGRARAIPRRRTRASHRPWPCSHPAAVSSLAYPASRSMLQNGGHVLVERCAYDPKRIASAAWRASTTWINGAELLVLGTPAGDLEGSARGGVAPVLKRIQHDKVPGRAGLPGARGCRGAPDCACAACLPMHSGLLRT